MEVQKVTMEVHEESVCKESRDWTEAQRLPNVRIRVR